MKTKRIYGFVMLLCLWYLLHIVLNRGIIPSPFSVFMRFTQDISRLVPHFFASLMRVLMAVLGTILIGLPIGLFLGRHEKADRLLSPIVFTLFPVPKIAFLPVLMLFFGLGNSSKILLIGLVIVFQIIIHIRDRVKNIDKEMFYAIESLGANQFQIYQHVILPAILPSLLTALRISIGTSLSVLFFAENYATDYGLGFYIMDSWLRIAYVDMFVGIVMLSLLGVLLFTCIDLIEKATCKWVFLGTRGM